MGKILENLYQQVKDKNGEISLYRLVIKTKITMEMAKELDDSDENKKIIMDAIDDLGLNVEAVEQISKRKSLIRRIFGR